MKRLCILLAVALVGCEGAHENSGGDDGPDGGMDVTCGSVMCDQIPAPACEGNTLHEYTAACADATCSYPSTDTECGAAGCCGDHCCSLAVSNADATGTLMPTGLTVSPPNGTFNTDSECLPTSALGSCSIVARTGLPEACVCRMDVLSIDVLEVTGSRALVLLAYESVRIQTSLDVSGDRDVQGPGAMPSFYTTVTGTVGGAGGSFATGGAGATGNPVTVSPTYGDVTLVPLYGGSKGQTGGYDDGSLAFGGGGGGGALQISAGKRIEVLGAIYAGGGGGRAGYGSWASSGASGGGSGGAILLEAPSIMMTGTLNANGGGGGGGGGDGNGNTWTPGEDANDDLASGGQGGDAGGCALYGSVYGGDGGNGATQQAMATVGGGSDYDSRCFNTHFVGGGGGGGGLGRIRINTVSGCQCNGTVSPSASFGMLAVQ
jgi:hypothetical protein